MEEPVAGTDRRIPGVIAALAGPLLVLLVTVFVFAPALDYGFVAWDDPANLVDNEHYRGLGWENIRWAFTSFLNGHYMPLVWLSWSVDYQIWGERPFGFHLTNLILHVLSALLVYLLALNLLAPRGAAPDDAPPRMWGLRAWSTVCALLFAVHPLRVESVVWATERKDVLSAFFYLLTVWIYVRSEGRRWGFAAAVYVLAVLSKVMVVSLPIVLLVLDAWPLHRIGGAHGWTSAAAWRVYRQKIPFVLLAVAAAAVAPLAQTSIQTLVTWADFGLAPRLAASAYGLMFYLHKTIVPLGLSPLYELPAPLRPTDAIYIFCAVGVALLAVLIWLLRRRCPALAAAGACYVLILLPVLGLVQNGPQIAADRYSYLACIGWVMLLCAALLRLARRSTARHVAALAVMGVAIGALGGLSRRQCTHWRDARSLWKQALRVEPDCSFCHNAMGRLLADEGKLDEAEEHYRQAIEDAPHFADPHNNLGLLLLERQQVGEALSHLNFAVTQSPDYGPMNVNYANALTRAGRLDEAIEHYARGLADEFWEPPAEVYNNAAYVLITRGRYEEAREHAARAIRLDPSFAEAHYNLGAALLGLGATDQAIESFDRCIRAQPDDAQPYVMCARKLADHGLIGEALRILQTGRTRRPNDPRLAAEISRLQQNENRER